MKPIALLIVSCLAVFGLAQIRWVTMRSEKAGAWKAVAVAPVFSKSEVAAEASRQFKAAAKTYFDEFMQEAKQNPQRVSYELDVKPTIAINRAEIISGYYTAFSFTGGAHPNTYFKTITVGVVDGKARMLKSSDIVASGRRQRLMRLLQAKLEDAKKAKGMGEADPIDPSYLEQFVVTPGGVTWMFEPYAVGAYVEGSYLLKCTWSELEGIVTVPGMLISH